MIYGCTTSAQNSWSNIHLFRAVSKLEASELVTSAFNNKGGNGMESGGFCMPIRLYHMYIGMEICVYISSANIYLGETECVFLQTGILSSTAPSV